MRTVIFNYHYINIQNCKCNNDYDYNAARDTQVASQRVTQNENKTKPIIFSSDPMYLKQ